MLSNGVDPTTVAAILGHSSPTVTLQIYSYLVRGAQLAAMDRLEQMRARVAAALENPNGYRGRFDKEKSPCYRAFNGCGDRI
jgi:hypothetical protein